MTLSDIKTILETTGITVAYDFIPEENFTGFPFIVYRELNSNNIFADGQVYFKIKRIQIQLYTKKKDTEKESLLESAISSLQWEKSEEYIDEEKCYQISYETEVY